MTDRDYMQRAIDLAKKAIGYTNPNPLVGAVIVKNDQIIGEGYHKKYGDLHAERNALISCKEDPAGGTIFVTLTPCCHHGKTPPCTDAIIEAGISKVIIGSRDPNPLVGEKSIQILKKAGIQVICDFMKEECDALNPVFFHYITTKKPYVVLKYAMTMDGKIATRTGASKWITGEIARRHVHESRHQYMAIMTGVGTVKADDPELTCRIEGGKNPIRIICDSHLNTPVSARVIQTANHVPTIIATCCKEKDKHEPYMKRGCRLLEIGRDPSGSLDLTDLMDKLGAMGIDSILLEGGSMLNWSAFKAGIVNRVHTYIGPKIFGGADAKSPVAGQGVELPDQAFRLLPLEIKPLGEDILIESEVISCSQEL